MAAALHTKSGKGRRRHSGYESLALPSHPPSVRPSSAPRAREKFDVIEYPTGWEDRMDISRPGPKNQEADLMRRKHAISRDTSRAFGGTPCATRSKQSVGFHVW